MLDYLQSKQFLIDALNLLLTIGFVVTTSLWFIVLA